MYYKAVLMRDIINNTTINQNLTVLVTGINGFVGQHLARELKQQGHTVFGTGLNQAMDSSVDCDRYFGPCDLTKKADVKNIDLDAVDAVINLAGLAQMGASFMQEDLYMHTNVAVHTTLAQRLIEIGRPQVRIVAVSSGAVYDPEQTMPLTENSVLKPDSSPYSRSKIAMETALEEYMNKGLDIIIARPFNHIGPGQTGGFLIPDLAKQITETKESVLKVGNLKTQRDYTDVRDVAKAYTALATSSDLHHSVYNVCSGKSVSGEEILNMLKRAFGRNDLKVEIDESKFRPNDALVHYGDNTRIHTDTDWRPTIALGQTIHDFTEWYQNKSR